MFAWQAIQESLEYIEEHYEEELNLDKLAAIAHLSKYYYQRLFYRLVKKTVMEYVKLRRLEKGACLLKNSNLSILEIAITCGFSGHSAFTRTFKETYQVTPLDYRSSNIHLDHFIKPDLSLNYVMATQGIPVVVGNMVLEINQVSIAQDIKFMGKSRLAAIDQLGQSKINNLVSLWQELDFQNKCGVDILTLANESGQFNYFVGIETSKTIPGYEQRIMPSGNYVVCKYEAENFDLLVNEALYKASRYLYEEWLDEHHLIPDDILIQKYFNPYQDNCYIELWIKLIK